MAKQEEIAKTVRDWLDVVDFREIGAAFTAADAIAAIVIDLKTGNLPPEVNSHFTILAECYRRIMRAEHERVMEDLVGKHRLAQLQDHPDYEKFICQVFDRVLATHGLIRPGLDCSNVNIDDLLEEMS